MPTTPPPDEAPETPASPYGPKPTKRTKATTPHGSESIPPVVPPEPVPRVAETLPAPLQAAPIPTLPPPPAPFGSPPAPPAPPAPYNSAPYQSAHAVPYGMPGSPYQSGPPKPPTTLSLLSMIFGIASVPFSCCWGFGFLLAVAGIVLGHVARKREVANAMAKAGLIISYVVAGLSVVVLLFFLGATLVGSLTGY